MGPLTWEALSQVGTALPPDAEISTDAAPANGLQQKQQPPLLQSIWGAMPDTMGIRPHPRPAPGQPGSFLVPATVWPGPRLSRDTSALSRSLHNSLGRPQEGACVVIYSWPDATQPPSAAASSAAADGSPACRPEIGLAGAVIGKEAERGPEGRLVYLRLCRNAATGGPAVADPASPLPAPPKAMQAPSPAKSTPDASPCKSPGAGGLSALTPGNARQRGAAEELAQRRLAGRQLLPGNPVVLTLVGQPLLFAVEASGDEALHGSEWAGVSIVKDTAVKVLLGDEMPLQPKAPAAPIPAPQVLFSSTAALL